MVLVYVNLFLKAREKAHYCLSKLSSLQVGVRAVSVFILASLLHIQFPIASANVLACCLIYCPCVKIVYITWPVQCLTFSLLFWGGLGFITMTPQLFINYKMKSVAHLPWRMLTYKALNTFIDDLFAFVIKMPMMYRIGCLRDGMSSLYTTQWSLPCIPHDVKAALVWFGFKDYL